MHQVIVLWKWFSPNTVGLALHADSLVLSQTFKGTVRAGPRMSLSISLSVVS